MNDWSTLQKGDKLYLLVPVKYDDDKLLIKYQYQESEVINVHHYTNCVNIRFKYTDAIGKRRRVELQVNKLKLNEDYLASNKRTGWAAEYKPEYGDLIVAYKNKEQLNQIYSEAIDNEIKKFESIVNDTKKRISMLNNIKYDYLV